MRKIRLDVDALRVDSFDTAAGAESQRGTVRGHSYPDACFPPSGSDDPFLDTCGYATCAGDTCWYSCGGSCGCGGTVGCPPQESAGYTYCMKDASCLNACFPPTG